MTARFTLVPFAALAIVSPAQATVYMSLEQALQAIFPGANFTPAFLTPDKAARNAIEKLAGSSLSGNEIKIWRVSGSGWLIADQAVGRHDYIPFVLGLDDKGAIKGLEILEYRESYGGQVREAAWRAQFNGKRQNGRVK